MDHEIKLNIKEFQRIKSGSKTFLALYDEDFQKGDTLTLREFDRDPQNATTSAPKGFTNSPAMKFEVGDIERVAGHSVLSLLPVKKSKS